VCHDPDQIRKIFDRQTKVGNLRVKIAENKPIIHKNVGFVWAIFSRSHDHWLVAGGKNKSWFLGQIVAQNVGRLKSSVFLSSFTA
jgi:hypothetical protein